MKINIGPYKNWLGPYQLAELLCFWAKDLKDEHGFPDKPEYVDKFGEWLAHGSVQSEKEKRKRTAGIFGGADERPHTYLYKFLSWIESKRERKVEIKIDKYDTWSMYSTLAMIILPMLKQLRDTNHGTPWVEDKDVPKALGIRSTDAAPVEFKGEFDDNSEARWAWVQAEMIWAFEQILDDDSDAQFHTGEHDTVMVPIDKDHNDIAEDDDDTKIKAWRMDRTDKDTSKYDKKGHAKHMKRLQRGTTLFGKYFQNLWD